jgi:hypothetical protein
MTKYDFIQKLNTLDLNDGNLPDPDAVALMNLAKQVAKPRCQFLEIGAWKGKSTACLAAVVAKENGTIWTVDHFQGTSGTKGVDFALHTDVFAIFRQNMKLINAWQSVVLPIIAPYEKVAELLPNNFFNFIYVDADNQYGAMRFVLENFWKKVKTRGIICGRNLLHRYIDVKNQVEEEIEKEYSVAYKLHPGIIKAVHSCFKGEYKRVDNSTLWFKEKK